MAKSKPTQDGMGRFISGNSGGGRPKGSRNKLGEAFIDDLYQDWQANGAETIARVREERPHDYLKVVASILPRDMNLKVSPFENMTDAELNASIERLLLDRENAEGEGWRPLSISQRFAEILRLSKLRSTKEALP